MPTSTVPEIQGLRAIAVGTVLLFHIWPGLVPGGFVGVDVFFVISGYLITGSLIRDIDSGRTNPLLRFYGRRIRRLMPAATLVALFCAASIPLLPFVQWPAVANDIIASSLYVQNWWLIYQSVDYLAQGQAPSLLQHYWSLSIEEQFYMVWPLLLILVAALSAKRALRTYLFYGLVLLVTASSLGYGIWLTGESPDQAYFSTFTRLWELGIGALLAVANLPNARTPPVIRLLAGWTGLALIIFSAISLSKKTAFPGIAALMPTIGAALVIVGSQCYDLSGNINNLLKQKPLAYIGDISYSLYLWHWPLIAILAAITGRLPGLVEGLALLGLSIILAGITKVHVEDRYRHQQQELKTGNSARSPRLAIACIAVILVTGFAIKAFYTQQTTHVLASTLDPAVLNDYANQVFNPRSPTIPDVKTAREDNPELYRRECHVGKQSGIPRGCLFGAENALKTLYLVGDSHAAQWLPTLRTLGYDRGDWKIITHTKSVCPFVALPVIRDGRETVYETCSEWNRALTDLILSARPDLVVTSMSSYRLAATDQTSNPPLSAGIALAWQPLIAAGIPIVNINDTPHVGVDIPECLSSPFGSIERCSVEVPEYELVHPAHRLAETSDGALSVNLNQLICQGRHCPPVKGQILIWRDSNHLTATFARYLAPQLGEKLSAHGIPMPDS